jgi:hypothetical protein
MSYTSLINARNDISAFPERVWNVLNIKVEKKLCASVQFIIDYIARWIELSGKQWKDGCLLWISPHLLHGNCNAQILGQILWMSRDKRATVPVSILCVNYPVLEPINRLLFDFKEAEAKNDRRRLYQLTGEWRDMKLLPLSNPKGPLNKKKFYRYSKDVRLSIHALLCAIWIKRPGRDVKNMLVDALWIQ